MPFIRHGSKTILFIHIPKTGGTSIEHWLASQGPISFHHSGKPSPAMRVTPQHLRYWDLRNLFAPGFFDYGFAVVRNPFRRMESEYRMRMLAIKGDPATTRRIIPFPLWLHAAIEEYRKNPFYLDNHLRPQIDFTSRHIEVFRYEDGLNRVVAQVADRTGLAVPARLERLRDGSAYDPAADGAIDWDVADIELMRAVYGRDFEEFGYPDVP